VLQKQSVRFICSKTGCGAWADRESQLELALLYYFAGHYEDALEEVSMLQTHSEATENSALELLPLFKQKLMLWKSLETA
jgi:hypothetical protein